MNNISDVEFLVGRRFQMSAEFSSELKFKMKHCLATVAQRFDEQVCDVGMAEDRVFCQALGKAMFSTGRKKADNDDDVGRYLYLRTQIT